jgi:hypothetical protein
MRTLIRFSRTVMLGFDARDMWMGLYVDPDKGKLYFCLLPCIVLVLGPYASLKVEANEDARDADEASMQAAFWRARAVDLGASESEYRAYNARQA